jgi:hypothetical protein
MKGWRETAMLGCDACGRFSRTPVCNDPDALAAVLEAHDLKLMEETA